MTDPGDFWRGLFLGLLIVTPFWLFLILMVI